jgi:hypothetical protein
MFESEFSGKFIAFVSHMDKNNHCIYVRPEYNMQDMEELSEELEYIIFTETIVFDEFRIPFVEFFCSVYYSNSISKNLLVDDVTDGLACVCKLEGVYHRVSVHESRVPMCAITYVDLGKTVKVSAASIEFKHLLNHFAQIPCLAIACRPMNVELSHNNGSPLSETYERIWPFFQKDRITIEIHSKLDDGVNAIICHTDPHCLDNAEVDNGLAVFTKCHSYILTLQHTHCS